MSINCTRCEGTGFRNADQFPLHVISLDDRIKWLDDRNRVLDRLGGCSCHINPPCQFCTDSHDIEICDCCGDGDDWYGIAGEHYNADDPQGPNGPYAGNGGLCQCH